jgi:hypothetical protein
MNPESELARRSEDLAHSVGGMIVAGIFLGAEVAIVKWNHLAGVLLGTQAVPMGLLATLYGVGNWKSAFTFDSADSGNIRE